MVEYLYRMNRSDLLFQTLQKEAKDTPDTIHSIETETDRKITYQELFFALASLQTFFGKKPQTIILAVSGGIENSVLWLVSLIFGHHLIPISPNTTEFEYQQIETKKKPTFLIVENTTCMPQSHTKRLTLSQCQSIITQGIKEKCRFKTDIKQIDGTVYLETSGSTGAPKGMVLTASQLIITADNMVKGLELTSNDRCLTPLPFYHVNAPVVGLLTSILSGSSIVIAPKFSASRFWSWVEKYNPTWISIVPTILAILLKDAKPSFLTNSTIRFFRTGSAPLPKTVLIEFEKKFGFPVIEQYGLSEAGSTIFSNPLPPKKHKPGSVGFPLGIDAKIIASGTGEKVKQGEIGEICVKGKQVISHYEEGRGKNSFRDGWFITGDLGYVDEEGYLFLTSRKKDVIIRGSENIIPREIEEVILTYPGIVEVAVVGQPDAVLGEKVVAFLVTENEEETNLTDNILTFVTAKLSPQKIPADIYILDELPKKRLNKIDKNALKNLLPSNNMK